MPRQSAEDKANEATANPDMSALEAANEQGFIGQKVDPTPNEAYTVAGVTSGQPTPETDEDAAAKADEAQRDAGESADADNG